MGIRRRARKARTDILTAREVLDRTLLLMRDHLLDSISDAQLVNALTSVKLVFVADRSNLDSPEGQHALVAAVVLCARSGARCHLEIANVPQAGVHAPLHGGALRDALLDFGSDLVPGLPFEDGMGNHSIDLAVIIGDTPWSGRAHQVIRLSGDSWACRMGLTGERWRATGSPFGALGAAGLAAGEAFKVAMRRLKRSGREAQTFATYFGAAPSAQVTLAPKGT